VGDGDINRKLSARDLHDVVEGAKGPAAIENTDGHGVPPCRLPKAIGREFMSEANIS
jgi:hypothetical protein